MLKIDAFQCAKDLGVKYNVTFRILDAATGKLVSEHIGHNQATNSMLTGIAHYLKGDGILNQATHMLSRHIPRYISLGTMGLISQEEEVIAVPTETGEIDYINTGLPAGIGDKLYENDGKTVRSEADRFQAYINTMPGYGADGYDSNRNNGRNKMGLGPVFAKRDSANTENPQTVECELISETFPRAAITYREIVPETHAELPETIDIIYSAMISTGALAQFREPGKDYVFITEAGLWSSDVWTAGASNGLLAGYRIAPPDEKNWDMTKEENRELLKRNIIKVRKNQVVQVIWKIQIGSHRQLIGKDKHCDCTCPSSDCPCHGGKPPEPEYPKISLNIVQDNCILNPTESTTLDLDIITTYEDGHQDVERWTPTSETKVIWLSNNPSIISVDTTGKVTSLSAGSATITAKLSSDNSIYDDCKITSKIQLPLDNNIISYAMLSTGSIYLGARVQVSANQLAVKEGLTWEASGNPDGVITGIGDNPAMYILGVNTSEANPAIVSNGWNYFDIDVYAPNGITHSLSNYSTPDGIYRSGSLHVLPDGYTLPSIKLIDVKDQLQTLPHLDVSLGYSAVITEECATILSPTQLSESSPFVQMMLSDGRKVSGYLVGTIESTKVSATCADGDTIETMLLYGYGPLHMNSSAESPVHVYLEPGNYAMYQILHSGNFAYFEFVSVSPSTPTLLYVQERMQMSDDGFIINNGDTRSGLIYCAGGDLTESDANTYPAFSCGTNNELRLYVEAPTGTINIRNNSTVNGCLYAKHIVLGNDVKVFVDYNDSNIEYGPPQTGEGGGESEGSDTPGSDTPSPEEELAQSKELLVNILSMVDVEASTDESLSTLILKILDIYGITYFIKAHDSFGPILVETQDVQMLPFSDNVGVTTQNPLGDDVTDSFAPIQIEVSDVTFDSFGETISSELA